MQMITIKFRNGTISHSISLCYPLFTTPESPYLYQLDSKDGFRVFPLTDDMSEWDIIEFTQSED